MLGKNLGTEFCVPKSGNRSEKCSVLPPASTVLTPWKISPHPPRPLPWVLSLKIDGNFYYHSPFLNKNMAHSLTHLLNHSLTYSLTRQLDLQRKWVPWKVFLKYFDHRFAWLLFRTHIFQNTYFLKAPPVAAPLKW